MIWRLSRGFAVTYTVKFWRNEEWLRRHLQCQLAPKVKQKYTTMLKGNDIFKFAFKNCMVSFPDSLQWVHHIAAGMECQILIIASLRSFYWAKSSESQGLVLILRYWRRVATFDVWSDSARRDAWLPLNLHKVDILCTSGCLSFGDCIGLGRPPLQLTRQNNWPYKELYFLDFSPRPEYIWSRKVEQDLK